MVDRRIKAARFPATKSLDTFDFLAMPSGTSTWSSAGTLRRRFGNSGTGKTHVALGLGLAA